MASPTPNTAPAMSTVTLRNISARKKLVHD
jgi:hypothetical protein